MLNNIPRELFYATAGETLLSKSGSGEDYIRLSLAMNKEKIIGYYLECEINILSTFETIFYSKNELSIALSDYERKIVILNNQRDEL